MKKSLSHIASYWVVCVTTIVSTQVSGQTINTIGETDTNNLGSGYQVSTSWSLFQSFRTPSGYTVLSTLRFPVSGTGVGTVSVREFTNNTFGSALYSYSLTANGSSTIQVQPSLTLDSTKTYALYWNASSGTYNLSDVYSPSSYYYADGQAGYVSAGGSVSSITDASFEFYMNFSVAGPDSANTLTAITSSAGDVRNQLVAREAVLTSALDYDSNEFGKNNMSVSFIGRYTGLSDSTSEGAGALVAAYRITPNIRLGAFVDYAVSRDTPTGIKHGDAEPTVGIFSVYEQNTDRTGFNARVAGAYNHGSMTMTRDASLTDTEAGSGKAGMNAFALSAEAGYGVRIAPTFVAVPYLGIRYTDVTRKGYAEAETTDVTAPLSYSDYGQKLTTALGGVRFHGEIGERVSAFVGLGAEYDIDRKMDAYSGTSSITDLETFSIATNSHPNRLRASVSAGVAYKVAANQSLSGQIGLRQQAYSADPSVVSMVKYSVGF